MARTLIINPGSTSRKYALYQDGACVAMVYFEATGTGFTMSVVRNGTEVLHKDITQEEFGHALEKITTYFVDSGDIETIADIEKVGVRVVAPGTYFLSHRTIDTRYLHELQKKEDVAPLHIPNLISEILSAQKILSKSVLYGISDSAFHSTIPEYVRTISIPKADAQVYDIQRFGYHGLSFSSIAHKLESRSDVSSSRVVVCHIGGGVSIAALKEGKSVATSMGYSPVSGLMMGSRGGDVTAGVVAALTEAKGLRGKELYKYLYEESGFQGVAGVRDLRVLLERRAVCDPDATLAVDMFIYQMRAWIGQHTVHMQGLDTIVLTATASVRNPTIRKMLLSDLSVLGITIDDKKNERLIGGEGFIHAKESRVKVLVLKTDEMGEIERACQEI